MSEQTKQREIHVLTESGNEFFVGRAAMTNDQKNNFLKEDANCRFHNRPNVMRVGEHTSVDTVRFAGVRIKP